MSSSHDDGDIFCLSIFLDGYSNTKNIAHQPNYLSLSFGDDLSKYIQTRKKIISPQNDTYFQKIIKMMKLNSLFIYKVEKDTREKQISSRT